MKRRGKKLWLRWGMEITNKHIFVALMVCCVLIGTLVVMTAAMICVNYIPTSTGFEDDPPNAFVVGWSIRSEPIEHLYVLDKDTGEVLFHATGTDHDVAPPEEYVYMLPDSIVIHNHPPPYGAPVFSDADLQFLDWSQCDELWVVTTSMCVSIDSGGTIERKSWSELGYG
jgi:hypothetical protein